MGRIIQAIVVAVFLGLLVASAAQAADPNLVKNGSFEEGFVNGVAKGWTAFNNGGNCFYGFAADDWKPLAWDGQNSQLIVIESGGGESDRYAGIYQTVSVVPGATYELTLHGMVRSTEGSVSASGYGYRLQWAIDYDAGTDWQKVDPAAWQELDWYEWPLGSPGFVETSSAKVTAKGSTLTLFVRAWKKWGSAEQEGNFNLDGITLAGVKPAGQSSAAAAPVLPAAGVGPIVPALSGLFLALMVGAAGLRAYRRRGY